ncbi:hypothetical protein INT45_010114 [Circinella minor]|uniref:Uncharacterized protein n=1 Tax=Circinella minor TaxID=1195481 RepID=A0A8H7R0L1_9FUNG|nr:hypothetical protein INT45_010114 [Circinella minor]
MADHLENICADTNQHQRQHPSQAIDLPLLHHPTIEDDDSPFKENHITGIIKKLANGKAPGADGFKSRSA